MKNCITAPAGRRRHVARTTLIGAGALLASGIAIPAAQAATCAAGAANITTANATVVEGQAGQTLMAFQLTRGGDTTCDTTVTATTTNLSATSGSDYTAQAATVVTFAGGQTTAFLFVPVFGDTIVEPDETFRVDIAPGTGTPIINNVQVLGTITNDDPAANNPNPQNPNPQNPPVGAACGPDTPNTGNNNRGYGNSGNNNRGNCNSGNNNRGDNNTGNNNRP
ncbi:MAG: Calx-beta domain-containing protein [Sporichthyaceae bacterium]